MTLRSAAVALCFLATLSAATVQAQQEAIVFSPREAQDVAISRTLLATQSTLDMALYSISHESEWVDDPGPNASAAEQEEYDAFRARLLRGDVLVYDMIKYLSEERGVRCRLVLNRAALDSWAVARAEAYEDAGVQVRWTHKTMHSKFAIVDNETLINGSANWSRGAAERYSENTGFFHGHRWLTKKFAREFDYLWNTLFEEGRAEEFDAQNLPQSEPDTKFFVERDERHYDSDPVEAYFTSENGSTSEYVCADVIIEEMRNAKEQVLVLANHFNMGRISNALIRVHRERNEDSDPTNDLEIKVLMDLGEYDQALSGVSRAIDLERAGIDVRYNVYGLAFFYPKAQFMHHKVLITDSNRLITGSYNWSRTAEHKNLENITLHRGASQQDFIDAMEREFWYLWDLRRDLYPAFLQAATSAPGDADYQRFVPMHFLKDLEFFHSPMSLTRDEIDAFRRPLEALGYEPPSKDDPGAEHGRLYFDKETGEYTNSTPSGTFVADEDGGAIAPPPPFSELEPTPTAHLDLGALGNNPPTNVDPSNTNPTPAAPTVVAPAVVAPDPAPSTTGLSGVVGN